MNVPAIKTLIETHFDKRNTLNPQNASPLLKDALDDLLNNLEKGHLRVAEKIKDHWVVHSWIKQAVLLYFRIHGNLITPGGFTQFYDKVPLRFTQAQLADFEDANIRICPPATIRRGAYIGPRSILMPCFVNIGAYIGEGTMIDSWATVGSCAQIGKNVHVSMGSGIGGVLEPLQANPTIIEDNCFIGANSSIVEGVIVEENAVISMGVNIGQSTKIYNRLTGEISYGRIPKGAVVIAGSLPSPDKTHQVACAVIVKIVDEATRAKVALNELLRD
ncbi:MAG: 2,3,4,5-tetrahydropyridine-2,6-dicarboxylate N-succinyltransferase [Francisellaceae bacterium]|nr:2,3,4,5-tetrahydropyridine-2,6-dicarboxylate N-succinyltransferase [Francisellaceae bacterium]